MNKNRQEKIKNAKLKKLLLEKEDLTGQKNDLLVEHDEWRKDFTERLEKVKEKINKVQDKVVREAKDIKIIVGDFEEIRSVEVVGDEVIVNIVDKIEEFKEAYLKAKEEITQPENIK